MKVPPAVIPAAHHDAVDATPAVAHAVHDAPPDLAAAPVSQQAPAAHAPAKLGAQIAVPTQALPPPGGHAPAHAAAPAQPAAAQQPIAAAAPDPALAKMSKGQLARKTLEATDVSGVDASGAERSSPRGMALATAISKGAFQAAADALAGPSFDKDDAFQTAFIAAWKGMTKGYDPQGKKGDALLDPILQTKFKGNKLGYLKDLRQHGQSSAEWSVLLCLGEVAGGSPHEDAVVRAFERAAETLDDAAFQAFWARVKGPIESKMKHTVTSSARFRRVMAAKNLKDSEAPVVAAEKAHEKAEEEEHTAAAKAKATKLALDTSKGESAAKQDEQKATAGKLQKANLDENTATASVATETAVVDKQRADATKADADFDKANNQLILDTQALQAANAAHEKALQALGDANFALKQKEHQKAALAAASSSAPQPGAASKDDLDESVLLARKVEVARSLAEGATQTVAAAHAQIEKLQAQLQKSRGTTAAAWASQQDAHDSLADHEKELRARQDKLEEAKKTVEAAQKSADAAKAEAVKAKAAVDALQAHFLADTAELKHAKDGATAAKDTLDQKKAAQVAGGTEVKYLASLIESLAGKLNDFDREAIEQLSKWAAAHKQAVPAAMAPGSAFLLALDAHIKKPRNRDVFKGIIEGKHEALIKTQLTDTSAAGGGFDHHETEEGLDEVTMTHLVVERETAKHRDKKIQIRVGPAKIDHAILKQQVMSMSPEAREQYLAFATKSSKAKLQDEQLRAIALTKLDEKFRDECGIVDAKERERMLALFKVSGAGVNYSKLYGLVHTTDPKKYATDDDFARKALDYITDFNDSEFHQLRQDKEILAALKTCKKKDAINKLVGGLDANGDIAVLGATKADADKARTDAVHEAGHWSTLINVEMDKWRLSLFDERHRNDVYTYGHGAQQAALEVSKTKNPGSADAAKPTHADAQAFVKAVWSGVAGPAKKDMQAQYGDLAAALERGHEVTLEMVLGSIAKWSVGSAKFHVDKADIKKTIETSRGTELLQKWSNIGEFTEGKKGVVGDPAKEREFKRSFVLDINADKRTWLDQTAGSDSIKYANTLRQRFKDAAENDAEFKAGLEQAGYDNTQFNRDKMEFRGILEKASKQRKGWDVGYFSSKGHVQHQAHREVVGGLRKANKDDQGINAKKDGHNDQDIDHERDEHFEEHHAKGLDEKKEELEISGEEFDKLRENIRKYTEIAIGLIITIAVSAATMGTVPAWAVLIAKLGAIVVANIVKEAVGAAITGDNMNGQKIITNIVAESVGTVAGGFAGTASVGNVGEMNAYLKEFIKGTVTSVTKNLGKDTVKGMAQRNTGDLSVSAAIKNQILGFVVATAASQLSTFATAEAGAERLEHDKASHEAASEPDKQSLEHLNGDVKPEATASVAEHTTGVADAQSTVDGAQHTVDIDNATVGGDHSAITADTSHLASAHTQVDAAQQHLSAAQQHYHDAVKGHADARTIAYDKHQLDLAKAQLHTAQTNLGGAQHSLEADQAKLEGDEATLSGHEATLDADKEALATAQEHLASAKEDLESINKQIEDLEAAVKPHEDAITADEAQIKVLEDSVGQRVDFAADKILDVPVDIIREKIEDRHAEKLEHVTPKAKAAEAAAPAAPAAHGAAQHGAAPAAHGAAPQHGAPAHAQQVAVMPAPPAPVHGKKPTP